MLSTRVIHLGSLQVKFRLLVAIFVVMLMAVLVRLGIWQLDRAAEKNVSRNQTMAVQAKTPLPIEGLFDGSISTQEEDLATVNLSLIGQFINERSIWVANQMYDENIGYEVMTPFRLQSNDKLILVSRGWANARAFDQPDNYVKTISETVTLTGLLQTKPFTHEQENKLTDKQWPIRIAHVDTQEISTLLEESVFPYVVRLNEGSPGLLIRHWKTVSVKVDKNYSYALQWFAMAIAVLIVALYLSSNMGELFSSRGEDVSNLGNKNNEPTV